MAGFNINDFKSNIQNNSELLRTNKFMVSIPTPTGLTLSTPNQTLMFACHSVPLPGLGLLTSDTARYGTGPIERKPFAPVVNDTIMQFYVDGDNYVRTIFVQWLKLIVRNDSRNSMSYVNSDGSSPYEFSYKSDYAVDITISVYDNQGNLKINVVLIEAYPNYVGDIALNWNDKNSIMTLPVGFTYRDWYETTIPQ